jgi:hypothetical protein
MVKDCAKYREVPGLLKGKLMQPKMVLIPAIAALLLQPAVLHPQSMANRPVMVGGNLEFDACGSIGVPKGLNPKGDNFLALKSAPNLPAKRKAKLRPGQNFILCDRSADDQWLGVVVPLGKQTISDCGLGGGIAKRQAYRGPCMQGWVMAKYVQEIAG